jgi:hypothetical protein
MNTKVNTLACLFFSAGGGGLAVRLIVPPLAQEYQTPEVPRGMLHAVRLLGLSDRVRTFKRTVEGAVPVYEEI